MWIISKYLLFLAKTLASVLTAEFERNSPKNCYDNVDLYVFHVTGCFASQPGATESLFFGKSYGLMSQGHDLKVEQNSNELSNYIIGTWHLINVL